MGNAETIGRGGTGGSVSDGTPKARLAIYGGEPPTGVDAAEVDLFTHPDDSAAQKAIIDSVLFDGGGAPPPTTQETLRPSDIEVRIGDPKTDLPRLLELFTQPAAVEHLAGLTHHTKLQELREIYEDPSLVLLAAETPSGLVIGTFTAQKPSFGLSYASGHRLAVDERFRRLGTGEKLIKTFNALVFTDRDKGGFEAEQARVGVIVGKGRNDVEGDWIPQMLFRREGYRSHAELERTTWGWSNRLNKLVLRNAVPMTLDRRDYRHNRPDEVVKYMPKQRPAAA